MAASHILFQFLLKVQHQKPGRDHLPLGRFLGRQFYRRLDQHRKFLLVVKFRLSKSLELGIQMLQVILFLRKFLLDLRQY